MDDNRFDALTKILSGGAGRRHVLIGLLGGTLASLVAGLTTAARPNRARHQRRDRGHNRDRPQDGGRAANRVSQEKKKKKKKPCPPCKKRKKGKCRVKLPDGAACLGGTCRSGSCVPRSSGGGGSGGGSGGGGCVNTCPTPGLCTDRPDCGNPEFGCSCGTTVEGCAFCTVGGSCGSMQTCATTSECLPGFACSKGCCDEPVCIPPCGPPCESEGKAVTCARKCGLTPDNCGYMVDCGYCTAGLVCLDNACVLGPDPEVPCGIGGGCMNYDLDMGFGGSCNLEDINEVLCPAANGNADFDTLHRVLNSRGFTILNDRASWHTGPHVMKMHDPAFSLTTKVFVVPFVNTQSGETAGLFYGEADNSSLPRLAMAVIGDANHIPTLVLVFDNGEIREVVPEQASLRAQRQGGRDPAPAASQDWYRQTCRRCTSTCESKAETTQILLLGGIGVAGILAAAYIGAVIVTGGVAVGVVVAMNFLCAEVFASIITEAQEDDCPVACGCIYCNCTDACYTNVTECTRTCLAGLDCFGGICRPARRHDC